MQLVGLIQCIVGLCNVNFLCTDKQRKKEHMNPITITVGTASTSPLDPDAGGAKADDQVEMEENIAYEKVNGFKLTKNVAYPHIL